VLNNFTPAGILKSRLTRDTDIGLGTEGSGSGHLDFRLMSIIALTRFAGVLGPPARGP